MKTIQLLVIGLMMISSAVASPSVSDLEKIIGSHHFLVKYGQVPDELGRPVMCLDFSLWISAFLRDCGYDATVVASHGKYAHAQVRVVLSNGIFQIETADSSDNHIGFICSLENKSFSLMNLDANDDELASNYYRYLL
jgi:hypothetical protein